MNRKIVERVMRSGSVLKIASLSQTEVSTFDSLGSVGGKIWPSAEHLINYFENSNAAVKGKRILELGSGCGYCGIALGSLGARQVVLSDLLITESRMEYDVEGCLIQGESMAPNAILLDLCRHNIEHNKSNIKNCEMNVEELKWGAHYRNSSDKITEKYDQFDLIVGSDLTYHPDATEDLFWTVSYLLNSAAQQNKELAGPRACRGDTTKFILAHQCRRDSSTLFALECAKKMGLRHSVLQKGEDFLIWEFSPDISS